MSISCRQRDGERSPPWYGPRYKPHAPLTIQQVRGAQDAHVAVAVAPHQERSTGRADIHLPRSRDLTRQRHWQILQVVIIII